MLEMVQNYLVLAAPDMPPEAWWVALAVLTLLGVSAGVDLLKGIVPDPIIFFGTIGIVAAKGIYIDWPYSAHQLTFGIIAMALIWGINEIWFRSFKQDALGLGDAKWSMLAVTTFGAVPVLFAWGIGAVMGCIWIVLQKIARRKSIYLHFAPFLFVGLLIGLWAVRIDHYQSLLVFLHPA